MASSSRKALEFLLAPPDRDNDGEDSLFQHASQVSVVLPAASNQAGGLWGDSDDDHVVDDGDDGDDNNGVDAAARVRSADPVLEPPSCVETTCDTSKETLPGPLCPQSSAPHCSTDPAPPAATGRDLERAGTPSSGDSAPNDTAKVPARDDGRAEEEVPPIARPGEMHTVHHRGCGRDDEPRTGSGRSPFVPIDRVAPPTRDTMRFLAEKESYTPSSPDRETIAAPVPGGRPPTAGASSVAGAPSEAEGTTVAPPTSRGPEDVGANASAGRAGRGDPGQQLSGGEPQDSTRDPTRGSTHALEPRGANVTRAKRPTAAVRMGRSRPDPASPWAHARLRYDTRELCVADDDGAAVITLSVDAIASVEPAMEDDTSVVLELVGDPEPLFLSLKTTEARFAFWKELRFMVHKFRTM